MKKKLSPTKEKTLSDNGLDNTFQMVVLASMRAKEIFMGSKPLIRTNSSHPCDIAIEEIKRGKVKYKRKKTRRREMIYESETFRGQDFGETIGSGGEE